MNDESAVIISHSCFSNKSNMLESYRLYDRITILWKPLYQYFLKFSVSVLRAYSFKPSKPSEF